MLLHKHKLYRRDNGTMSNASTSRERLDKMIDGLHNAVAEAYEKGYSDASREIMSEAIGTLESRISHAGDNTKVGLESALAILKALVA
jgi:hypothetical protein